MYITNFDEDRKNFSESDYYFCNKKQGDILIRMKVPLLSRIDNNKTYVFAKTNLLKEVLDKIKIQETGGG